MEPYQYWTIFGFLFLVIELLTSGNIALIISGAAFSGAALAYKYPNLYLIQFILGSLAGFMLYAILRKEIQKLYQRSKNGHK